MANQMKQLLAANDANGLFGGEVFYMVDSDFRTAAQGWTQADGTGPLDIWATRNPGRVFRTEDGVTEDDSQLQAAIDAMVDWRGDALVFTPGAYTSATALTLNVPNSRFIGASGNRASPRSARQNHTSITGVADLLTVSVDNVEIGGLRIVPITATAAISVSTGADYGYIHDCFYDAGGVTGNTGTEFVDADDTTDGWLVERVFHEVDALQGDCYTLDGAVYWTIQDSHFVTKVASYATVFTLGTNCEGVLVTRCHFYADADGTYTNIFTGETNSDQQLFVTYCIFSGTAISDLDNIETGFGTTQDIEIAENYQTGDATTETGVIWDMA